MGFFDQIIGDLAGGGANSPIQGVLSNLLGGQGGPQGLVGTLERAGLGQIAQSWLGNGPNQAISPDQLRGALGEGQVQSMSAQTGMNPSDLLSQLAQHLPGLIDRMSPNGALPAGEGGAAPAGGSAWDETTNA